MINRQPRIIKDLDNEWITLHPESREDYFDAYYEAVELMSFNPKKAEKIFKMIITACGNGHLDSISHLGLLYCDNGKPIEGNALITKAYHLAVDAFPKTFKPGRDQLHWGEIDNRPILRAFHCYGLELMKELNFEQAIKEFDFILKVNPSDNQGVRYLIIDCLFHLDQPEGILKLDRRYPGDYSVEFLYGKVLVYYLIGDLKKAERQLLKAKDAYPYVAEELLKTKHIFPADERNKVYGISDYGYAMGSRQEAFDYWSLTQQFWNKAKNIKKFIAGVE